MAEGDVVLTAMQARLAAVMVEQRAQWERDHGQVNYVKLPELLAALRA